jgi:hypothetical protein
MYWCFERWSGVEGILQIYFHRLDDILEFYISWRETFMLKKKRTAPLQRWSEKLRGKFGGNGREALREMRDTRWSEKWGVRPLGVAIPHFSSRFIVEHNWLVVEKPTPQFYSLYTHHIPSYPNFS